MKDEILQTSLKQFLKHGIRDVSIQKLVEPLGISSKTFYKHFTSKKELLEEVLHLFHTQQYQLLENLPADQSAACLFFDLWHKGIEIQYKINRVFFQNLHYYYPALGRKTEAAISKKFKDQFIRIIHEGIEEGAFRKDIVPDVALESIFILYVAIVRTEQFQRFRIPPFGVLVNTIAVYLRGVCTDKGVESLDEHIRAHQPTASNRRIKE